MSRDRPTLQLLRFSAKLTPLYRVSPLQQAIQSFLLDCEARSLSPKTLTYYRQDLATFSRFLTTVNVDDLQGVTPDIVRRYLVHLQETHNDGGVHGHYRALRAFVRFLVAEGDVTSNPLANVKAPRTPQTVLDPVSLDTVSKMLKACKGDVAQRDTAILLTLLDSGVRASELVALDVGDLDIGSGRVLVRHGKGDKARVVFFGARARKAILKMLRKQSDASPGRPLWQASNGERLTYWGLREILRRRARDAGVSAPSAHDFRRAFALLSLRGGCDIMSLQKLLGHADLTVLRKYLAQTESDLQAAHDKSSPADRMLRA